MDSDFKIYLMETSKEMIREKGEKITVENLVELYNVFINKMEFKNDDLYPTNHSLKFIKDLKPLKPLKPFTKNP